MNQNRIFVFLLSLLCSVSMMAQEKVITGKVTEALDNGMEDPIIGANVVLVNSQNRYVKGAVTDIDGNYYLQVPADSKNLKVRATYIGMKAKTVNDAMKQQLNHKSIKYNWHAADVSVLEGIFARGDRRLSKVLTSNSKMRPRYRRSPSLVQEADGMAWVSHVWSKPHRYRK